MGLEDRRDPSLINRPRGSICRISRALPDPYTADVYLNRLNPYMPYP